MPIWETITYNDMGNRFKRMEDGDKVEVKPLQYGPSVRLLKNFENPRNKGLKNGRFHEINDGYSTMFGYGLDTRTNDTGRRMAKRARTVGVPVQEANDAAVSELRKNDAAIMKALVDEGYTTRPDTISQGVRMLAAQARYNRGNIRGIFHPWAKAVIAGDAEGQKKAILDATKFDDRRNKVKTFDVYYGGWRTDDDRKGIVKEKKPKRFQSGGSVWTPEDVDNPVYSKKKPMTIQEQREYYIEQPKRDGLRRFDRMMRTGYDVMRLMPGPFGYVTNVTDLINELRENKGNLNREQIEQANISDYAAAVMKPALNLWLKRMRVKEMAAGRYYPEYESFTRLMFGTPITLADTVSDLNTAYENEKQRNKK